MKLPEPRYVVSKRATPDQAPLYYVGAGEWTENEQQARWWTGAAASAICEVQMSRGHQNVSFRFVGEE